MSIRVENLSKKYRKALPKDRLRDYFVRNETEEFYALSDISFQVQPGEKVAIMGKNGAGKSTLLKLLNKITTPTSGKVEVVGRMVSLIELGSGFHPELSGRENIYLYGAILGLSRKQIREKFDSIVAFSGVEPFLDLPVKQFSTGMYSRLGFSIAVHVDPDILVLDEVFSVGDLSFQQKCFEQLQHLSMRGVTLLFVGHDLDQLERLCKRGLLLTQGRLAFDGPLTACSQLYRERL